MMIPKFLCATALAASMLLVTACGVTYTNPPKDPTKTAVLKSKANRSGLYTWSNYVVQAVDNQPVSYAASLTLESKDIVLNAGNHDLVVEGSFNQGFMTSGPYIARGDIALKTVPGKKYQAAGAIKGSKLEMWIEDSETHKPVTSILSISYQNMPQSTFVPIIIPAG